MINIDLGKQAKNTKLDEVIKDMQELDLKGSSNYTTGDDLLDMMDNL